MVTAPVYADYLASFPWEQVAAFYTRLAEVTDYWDFSYSSVSFEPRYFYDETHFRECVGDMALAGCLGMRVCTFLKTLEPMSPLTT